MHYLNALLPIVLTGALILDCEVDAAIPVPGEHFYTTSQQESAHAQTQLGFVLENIAGYVYPGPGPTLSPLYRFYEPNLSRHFWTTSTDEPNPRTGWNPEGIAGYVYTTQHPNTVPLYRLFNEAIFDHLYTTSTAERDAVQQQGYRSEGVQCYLPTDSSSGQLPFLRLYRKCGVGQNPKDGCNPNPTGTQTDWLYTAGNKIYTSNGQPWHGRGANIQDTRSCNCSPAGISVSEVNRRVDTLVDGWKANFLRLTLESDYTSSVLDDPKYLSDIVQIVQHIGTKPNVYVLVSVWLDPSLTSMGWPSEKTNAVLQKLVDALHTMPQVLFGISNEPQKNEDGSLDGQVWTAMNNAVTAIRSTEAKYAGTQHIVTVQGTGGWSRNLQYYMDHPITSCGGSNVAYEVHVYDPESSFQKLFIDPSKVIPVIIGEFGPIGQMTLPDCAKLQVEAKANGVPYLAWTFHMRCPPNMTVDNSDSNNPCGVGMDLQPTDWGRLVQTDLAAPW